MTIERPPYRTLLEDLPDGWLLTEIAGTIQEANRGASALLHTTTATLLGQPLRRFVIPEAQMQLELHLIRLRLGLERRRGGWEVWLRPEDGAPFPAALTASAVHDPNGSLLGFQWLARDITRQKRTEAERPTLRELQHGWRPLPTPGGCLPICAGCRRVRGAAGLWTDLTSYLAVHFDLQFTHGLCPACMRALSSEFPAGPGLAPTDSLELPLDFPTGSRKMRAA